ncbi:MBL fold metallo-hydrolase [Cryobacterium tepidiphilum]|uniref:MBL fold metallo-hydrolase n=1 Tax=Cryobacterium tepidiphilum TaxID=2486026 RepID=A0A3M8KZJ1_9MICO|nr:MBL fold metallo-hydrolase [Cryobacterium tepidiphilum]
MWNVAAFAVVTVSLAGGALVASVVAVDEPHRFPVLAHVAAARHNRVDVQVVLSSTPETRHSPGGDTLRFRGRVTGLRLAGGASSDASSGAGSSGDGSSGDAGDAGALSMPVLVMVPSPPETPRGLAIGATVRMVGTLTATAPGDSTAALLFGRDPPVVTAAPPAWLSWASPVRDRFAAAAAGLPGDGAALLPGLAIGDTSAVGDDLDVAMKQSSLSHLTAVSGANCAVVIAAVMLGAALLRLARGARIALALLVLGAFVVLVTPDPSVLRASLMAVIVLASYGLGRPAGGVPALALAIIALLVVDPWLSRNYGFALSVLATAGLLVLAAPLARSLARWMPRWLATVIAIPAAAQLACQPVLVLLTPALPLYGVPANLLAAPAAPVATVLGLIACLLLPLLPGVAAGILHLAWLPSAFIAAVATTCAGLPGSQLPWPEGILGFVACLAVTVALIIVLVRGNAAGNRRWVTLAAVLLLGFAGSYAGSLLGSGWARARGFPNDWQIAACDIGQGDAVLVRDGDAHALVDVGPDPALLTTCLATLGITHIDLLVLTHYDLDHVGGVEAVIGKVGLVLVGPPENAQDERLHTRLAAAGATVREAGAGDSGTLGGLRWRVLWPRRDAVPVITGNPASVTVTFEGRGIRSIFLGDLGEDAQQAMMAAASPSPVDVVKVAHHGSADQSAALYRRLQATVGLISVGVDNGYGHPTRSLLGMLRASGTRALRTDQCGMILVAPGGEGGALRVWSERAPPALTTSGTSVQPG